MSSPSVEFKILSKDTINKRYIQHQTNIINNTQLILLLNIPNGVINIIVFYLEDDEIIKKEHLRQVCIEELLKTETPYIEGLKFYMKNYIDKLKDDTNVLSKKHYDILCPKDLFAAIISMHSLFHQKLSQRLSTFDQYETTIGDIFESTIIASSFVYGTFIDYYVNNRVNVLLDNKKSLRKLEKYELLILLSGVNYGHMNTKCAFKYPVSKWPRYALTVRSLIKYTPKYHPDYELLKHVSDKLDIIVNKINAVMKKFDAQRSQS